MLKHVWHHGFKILNEVFVDSCSTQDNFLVLNPIFSCTECASLKPNISRSKYLVWVFFEIAVHLLLVNLSFSCLTNIYMKPGRPTLGPTQFMGIK